MKRFNDFINEGVRELMKPVSEEEILKKLDHLPPNEKVFKGVEMGINSLVKDGLENGGSLFCNISYPISNGNIEMVELLVKYGYNIMNYPTSFFGYACNSGSLEMVKLFVEKYNYDVSLINMIDVVKLIDKGFLDIVKYLSDKRPKLKDYIRKKAKYYDEKAKLMYKCIN